MFVSTNGKFPLEIGMAIKLIEVHSDGERRSSSISSRMAKEDALSKLRNESVFEACLRQSLLDTCTSEKKAHNFLILQFGL